MKLCSLDKQSKAGKRLSTMINSQHAMCQHATYSNAFYDEEVASNARERFFNDYNSAPPLKSNYFACLPESRIMSPKPPSAQQRNSFDDEEYDQSMNFASPHQAAIYFDRHHQ